MSYHEFGYINRDKFIPIMHGQGVAHKIRGDRGTTTPGFDNTFLAFAIIDGEHLVFKVCIYLRTFFYRTSHIYFFC